MILSRREEGRLVAVPIEQAGFESQYDVIVAGLGTAGAIALLTAARKGLKVLGIEKLNCMGGTGTAGAVLGYYFGCGGGLYEEVDRKGKLTEILVYTPAAYARNGEWKKLVLEHEAEKAGAEFVLQAAVCGAYLEGKTVCGVQWIDEQGIHSAGAKMVIDCTADAELCALAGCEILAQGRKLDTKMHTISSVQVIINQDGRVVNEYNDVGYVNQMDGRDMSRAIAEGNATLLKDWYTEDKRLLYVAPMLGLREGRLIKGEESVAFQDYVHGKRTCKPLFYAMSNIDNHSKDCAFEDDIQQDWVVAASMWGMSLSVPIPLGALIPEGYSGILAAGRCISLDHTMSLAVRMQRDMQKCGEAAAKAAYLAIKDGVDVREVDYGKLALLLKETGCLDEDNNNELSVPKWVNGTWSSVRVRWLKEPEHIKAGLSSVKPGIAIWSCRLLGDAIRGHLHRWMKEPDENLRKHSAIVLGLLNDEAALPVLRGILAQGDSFLPQTSRKYNQVRGYAAIYLLGKLQDKESLEGLIRVVNDPASKINYKYTPDEYIANERELRFQYFSHALMALFRIGDKYPDTRKEIIQAVQEVVNREDFKPLITFKGIDRLEYPMKETVDGIVGNRQKEWGMEL